MFCSQYGVQQAMDMQEHAQRHKRETSAKTGELLASLLEAGVFEGLNRVWQWTPERSGDAYIVTLFRKDWGKWRTNSYWEPEDALQEAVNWLGEREDYHVVVEERAQAEEPGA